MKKSEIIVLLLTITLTVQRTSAVVNNNPTSKVEDDFKSVQDSANGGNLQSSSNGNAVDSTSASSEADASHGGVSHLSLSDSYGVPLSIGLDSYAPTGPSNPSRLLPVYGVPDNPTKAILYPAPPPDIPPPLPQIPSNLINLGDTYIPPKLVNSPLDNYGPPPPPPRLKPVFYKPLKFHGPPRSQYVPPKPLFIPKQPKPIYSAPSKLYGPPKLHFKPNYVPQKTVVFKPLPSVNFVQHQETYLPPIHNNFESHILTPHAHYGPPEPIPHGPPHPGVPAPPTPPDIKYDGWQPIPGLVSRPPSDSYGASEGQHHHHHHDSTDLLVNSDFTPPPISGDAGVISSSYSHSSGNTYGAQRDSYGAPLNTVTGSGGVVSSSGDALGPHGDKTLALGISAAGISNSANLDHSQLSVIKSVGFELIPNGGGNTYLPPSDTYSAPPIDSYSPNGPYAAAHSYQEGISAPSLSSHGVSLTSNGIGLIPPSGLYGVPPTGQYGTPLISKPSYPTGLDIQPPKNLVFHQQPLPAGFIQTDSKKVHTTGASYIPSLSGGVLLKEEHTPALTSLFSLPSAHPPVSFQNIALGSSTAGLSSLGLSTDFGASHGVALTSYNVPLGVVDGSYGVPAVNIPQTSVGLDNSHPPVTIDLTSNNGLPLGYHDCTLHKSQQLNYGYTNIGQIQKPHLTYGVPDLQTAHSEKVNSNANTIDKEAKEQENYGKSLAASFGPESELIKSESLDLNNIAVQGAKGSYTLQIQSANGLNANRPVSHSQVLNDGLLQSILAAIEQPQQQEDATVLGRPILELQQKYPSGGDSESQRSVTNAVYVSPPLTETNVSTNISETSTAAGEKATDSLRLLDNNEIALYFSNKSPANVSKYETNDENLSEESTVRNGQQYGSYVSFRTPTNSFVYGDLNPETDAAIKTQNK